MAHGRRHNTLAPVAAARRHRRSPPPPRRARAARSGGPTRTSTGPSSPTASPPPPAHGREGGLPARADAVPLPGRHPGDRDRRRSLAEPLEDGPTFAFAAEQARRHGVFVHASLYERPADDDRPDDPRGYNTAFLVAPDGTARRPDPEDPHPDHRRLLRGHLLPPGRRDDAYPVHEPAGLGVAARPADLLGRVVPRGRPALRPRGRRGARLPDGDRLRARLPRLRHRSRSGGRSSSRTASRAGCSWSCRTGTGGEGAITFYGSSFISDPFGRVLAEAPRDASAVLVADLDLAQRREWLALFPFLLTRRPDQLRRARDPSTSRHAYGAARDRRGPANRRPSGRARA